MSKYRKRNSYGPNSIKGRFIALRIDVMTSPAFRDLSPYAISVLALLLSRFNGSNNGAIHLTNKEIEKFYTNIGRTKAFECLKELQSHGFIKKTGQGLFTTHMSNTWEITCVKNAGLNRPSDDWKNWKPGVDLTSDEAVPLAIPNPRPTVFPYNPAAFPYAK